jgi:methyl-accepting chemotaxis protein
MLILLLAALFYYLTFKNVSANNRSMTIAAELTAQAVMEKVDRNFYERFGDVQAFAFNQLAVQTVQADSAVAGTQEFINTMTAYYVLYDLMMICDSNGRPLAVNSTDKTGKKISTQAFLSKNYADADWFQACMNAGWPKGEAWFSDFVASADIGQIYGTKGYGMAYAAPIRDESGNTIGVWYNFASWSEVTEGIREEAEKNLQTDHPGSFILITSINGDIISANNPRLYGKNLPMSGKQIIETNGSALNPGSDFVYGIANSKGAYTFKGKKWVTIAFIPAQQISWSVFFTQQNIIAAIICFFSVALLAFYVLRYFRKHIIRPLHEIKDLQGKLAEGEIVKIKASKKDDELSQMGQSLGRLAESLQYKADFADEISKGNLTIELKQMSVHDSLGTSLANMRDQLRLSREADEKRNWSSEGLAQIGNILRVYNSQDELYQNIIKFTVKYLNANQGGLFLISEENETRLLKLRACYAYDKRKFIEKNLDIDNGLIGQCINEKSIIHLTQIPTDYAHITSGLGGATPSSLLIIPLVGSNKVHGAIELASFKNFEAHQIQFVEKLAEQIAVSLGTIHSGEEMRLLVEQLQQQTEEMKAQEEEMRQNMEELTSTQEEMVRKEKEYLSLLNNQR